MSRAGHGAGQRRGDSEGRSDRGNFPVFKRPLKQWKMRITAYADRLIDDLDVLDWPESIKQIQRNWIGRSEGALIHFPAPSIGPAHQRVHDSPRHDVRRDLHGAGARAPARRRRSCRLAWPEGTPPNWTGGAETPFDAFAGYLRATGSLTDLERQVESRQKTGVFTGAYATNPATNAADPRVRRRLRADGLRHRGDHGRARPGRARLGVRRGLRPADRAHRATASRVGRQGLRRRGSCDQQRVPRRSRRRRREAQGHRLARSAGLRRRHRHLPPARLAVQPAAVLGRAVPDHLRRDGPAHRRARVDAAGAAPRDRRLQPAHVRGRRRDLDARAAARRAPTTGSKSSSTSATGRAPIGARRTRCRSGRARAGTSCATSIRPTRTSSSTRRSSVTGWDPSAPAIPEVSTSTWAASSTRCCTCSTRASGTRCCSTSATRRRSSRTAGCTTRATSSRRPTRIARGMYVDATAVEERDGHYYLGGVEVKREMGKMGKSLKNGISPDDYYRVYGADTLRLYEMFTGPARPRAAMGDARDRRRPPPAATAVAAGDRRRDRRACASTTRPRTTRRAACCTARSTRCAPTWRTCDSTPRSRSSPS